MDYPFLSKFWMFIAKKYSTFNEFIFFSEYSVLFKVYMSCSWKNKNDSEVEADVHMVWSGSVLSIKKRPHV